MSPIDPMLLTKVIATLGPASSSQQVIEQMMQQGARAFRLNLSHGTQAEHAQRIQAVRAASRRLGLPVAIIADLCGPRIRVGQLPEGGILLVEGQELVIQGLFGSLEGAAGPVLSISHPEVIPQVQPGHRILIDDGKIRLVCRENKQRAIYCTVKVGGRVISNKGINLPDTALAIPALTEKDYKDIQFAVQMEVDYIALSFVQCGDDIRLLKDELIRLGARP
ncbi:MAG: pyruvate kinase, partial [Sedimentisphaerales bacterium]|nr:pyruvate kinase [Sedimentisphaerales bacterium]